jgi:hypothetical protein
MKTIKKLQEHTLQAQCVTWFRYQYPWFSRLLFAVPNGAKRNHAEAAIKKSEGMSAGVSDLILLVNNGVYGSLCIEMKAGSSQSREQKRFEKVANAAGQLYVVVKSFEDFKTQVNDYLFNVDLGNHTVEQMEKFSASVQACVKLDQEFAVEDVQAAKMEYERMKQRMERKGA